LALLVDSHLAATSITASDRSQLRGLAGEGSETSG
jgi:hypothetical protein